MSQDHRVKGGGKQMSLGKCKPCPSEGGVNGAQILAEVEACWEQATKPLRNALLNTLLTDHEAS